MPRCDELFGDLPVALEALHLEERSLVPFQAKPLHRLDDRLDRGFRGALEIGVLDAQHERAAVAPRIGPREKRGARAADVQVARGAGRETGAYLHGCYDFPMGATFQPSSMRGYELPVYAYRRPPELAGGSPAGGY